MDILVFAITLFVLASLVAWWPAVRAVVAWRRPAAGILRDADLGYAEVALPPRWRPARFLNDAASLQALDPVRRRYLIVISESREDFKGDLTLDEHAAQTLKALADSVRVVSLTGPRQGKLGGFDMLQYEIEAFHRGTWVKYLHTTIAGRRAFHQVLGWATRSTYDRATFESLLRGFSELPGPDPVRLPEPAVTMDSGGTGRYSVH